MTQRPRDPRATDKDRRVALGWVAGQLAWESRLADIRAHGRAGGARKPSAPVVRTAGAPSAATAPLLQRPGAAA